MIKSVNHAAKPSGIPASKPVVLVYCQPVMGLQRLHPSITLHPQIGEMPLGILYLAGELERSGFGVVIKDSAIEPISNEILAREIAAEDPLIVGFSMSALNVRNVREISAMLKEIHPDLPIVWGGPHATVMPDKLSKLDCVDFLVTHQGEISFRQLAEAAAARTLKTPGNADGKIIRGQAPSSLDDLALPARHLVEVSKYWGGSYVMTATPVMSVCSSRGCPYSCGFCSSARFWERTYFTRSPISVVDEIELLINQYGAKGIYFREDNFTLKKKHVRGICAEILRRGLRFPWECESRVDSLSTDDLQIMKEAGCAGIWCGVESGSQRVLDSISKGYRIDQVHSFYQRCFDLEIPTGACFMLGFPGETAEDLIATYKLAESIPTQWVQFATYVGFPRSPIYERVMQDKLWEDQWEDVLIVRNECFSASQLYQLERAMNTIDKKPALEKRPGLVTRFARCINHPDRALEKSALILNNLAARIRGKHVSSADPCLKAPAKQQETFYDLISRFT